MHFPPQFFAKEFILEPGGNLVALYYLPGLGGKLIFPLVLEQGVPNSGQGYIEITHSWQAFVSH